MEHDEQKDTRKTQCSVVFWFFLASLPKTDGLFISVGLSGSISVGGKLRKTSEGVSLRFQSRPSIDRRVLKCALVQGTGQNHVARNTKNPNSSRQRRNLRTTRSTEAAKLPW